MEAALADLFKSAGLYLMSLRVELTILSSMLLNVSYLCVYFLNDYLSTVLSGDFGELAVCVTSRLKTCHARFGWVVVPFYHVIISFIAEVTKRKVYNMLLFVFLVGYGSTEG